MSSNPQHRLLSNRGGGYAVDVAVATEPDGGHVLRLRGPVGVVTQLCLTDPRYTVLGQVSTLGSQTLRGHGRQPTRATSSLLDLLSEVLTLPNPDTVAFALALDWYKSPVDGVESRAWPNTEIGDLVNRGKYWYDNDPKDAAKQRLVGLALVEKLRSVIVRHPLLDGVDAIVSVPGHDSMRVSFGSRLAAAVARSLQKPLVKCSCRSTFRTPAKNLDLTARAAVISNQFVCAEDLTGLSLLIIDDVYGSGSTVEETARAIQAAGAVRIAALCAVRTMRS